MVLPLEEDQEVIALPVGAAQEEEPQQEEPAAAVAATVAALLVAKVSVAVQDQEQSAHSAPVLGH